MGIRPILSVANSSIQPQDHAESQRDDLNIRCLVKYNMCIHDKIHQVAEEEDNIISKCTPACEENHFPFIHLLQYNTMYPCPYFYILTTKQFWKSRWLY